MHLEQFVHSLAVVLSQTAAGHLTADRKDQVEVERLIVSGFHVERLDVGRKMGDEHGRLPEMGGQKRFIGRVEVRAILEFGQLAELVHQPDRILIGDPGGGEKGVLQLARQIQHTMEDRD